MTTTAEVVAACRASADLVGPAVVVSRIRAFDTSAWIIYRRDEAEFQRRRGFSPAQEMSIAILDMLMDLPVGVPVPLKAVERHRLMEVPYGGVDVCDSTVVRQVTPPLTPLLAVVINNDWDEGLKLASRFAAYCSRMTVVPQLPDDVDYCLAQASFYGIGVATRVDGPHVLLNPEPLDDWQPTPALWRFSELIYRQVVRRSPASGRFEDAMPQAVGR